MMHGNGKNAVDCGEKFTFHRVAPLNSGFSQKAAKTPRGIHHGWTVTKKAPSFIKRTGRNPVLPPLFTNSSHCLPQQVHQKSDILRHDNVCLIRHSLLGTNNNSVGCAAPGCIRPPAETRASHQPAAFCASYSNYLFPSKPLLKNI